MKTLEKTKKITNIFRNNFTSETKKDEFMILLVLLHYIQFCFLFFVSCISILISVCTHILHRDMNWTSGGSQRGV